MGTFARGGRTNAAATGTRPRRHRKSLVPGAKPPRRPGCVGATVL